MTDNIDMDEDYYPPGFLPFEKIDFSLLSSALRQFPFLGDDPYLSMQSTNLGLVDQFLTELEYNLLRQQFEEERTPLPEAAFLSAQSQMWIFAAYELLRTWRQRGDCMIKWHENGGLKQKLSSLEKDQGYRHYGREIRAGQIKAVLDDLELITEFRQSKQRNYILFAQIEALRLSFAKHEIRKKPNSPALSPGYGRINRYCGSLDFEIENGQYSMGTISRREIADALRAMKDTNDVPTDDEIRAFEKYMRGTVDSAE